MRYMGDATGYQTVFFQTGAQPLDPAIKAQMIAAASSMDDGRAQDLIDITDASPLGHRTKLLRFGIGAVGGLLLGFGLSRLKKR
jgi:hypothetical protein